MNAIARRPPAGINGRRGETPAQPRLRGNRRDFFVARPAQQQTRLPDRALWFRASVPATRWPGSVGAARREQSSGKGGGRKTPAFAPRDEPACLPADPAVDAAAGLQKVEQWPTKFAAGWATIQAGHPPLLEPLLVVTPGRDGYLRRFEIVYDSAPTEAGMPQ